MNARFLAIAVLASSAALGQTFHHGQPSPPSAIDSRPHPPVTAPPTILQGDIEFVHGATVDFADVTQRVGRIRGFVYVRVGGELLLMPVYTLQGDPRVFRIEAP